MDRSRKPKQDYPKDFFQTIKVNIRVMGRDKVREEVVNTKSVCVAAAAAKALNTTVVGLRTFERKGQLLPVFLLDHPLVSPKKRFYLHSQIRDVRRKTGGLSRRAKTGKPLLLSAESLMELSSLLMGNWPPESSEELVENVRQTVQSTLCVCGEQGSLCEKCVSIFASESPKNSGAILALVRRKAEQRKDREKDES